MKKISLIILAAIALVVIVSIGQLVHTNNTGHVQVKQAAITGTMSVRNTPGTYFQLFGTITDYNYSDAVYLSAETLDGGDEPETSSIAVLFPDGNCDVDFVGQYEVRATPAQWLLLKERYPTQTRLKSMVREQVIEVITNSASLMNAEDAYSSKRADFIRLSREQLLYGLYKPTYITIYDTIQGGQVQETRIYDVAEKDGSPVIAKAPLLSDYGIMFSQFNIKRLHNFDDKTVELIDRRKEAKAASAAAITAKAKGEEKIAVEKATQEVAKIKEVTIAEKDAEVARISAEKKFVVAEYAAKEAVQKKAAIISAAQAKQQELLISDGLSDKERYTIDSGVRESVGVAAELAKRDVPSIVMDGGNGGAKQSGLANTYTMENMLLMMDKIKSVKKK